MNGHLPSQRDFEARLFLGLTEDKKYIVGTLDRQSLKPVPLGAAVKENETVTSLTFDPDKRALVFFNETSRRNNNSPDFVTSKEILAGANLSEIGGVGKFVDGGVAYTIKEDPNSSAITLISRAPTPVETGEETTGFLVYVPNPNDGESHYRTISPSINGDSDTILIGHPNGSVDFSAPVETPLLVPTANLTSGGVFSGTPNVASGAWRYQLMGTSQVVSNGSGSKVEVELTVRYSLATAGTRAGMYASLINGGADYATNFIEGVSTIKHDGGAGANAGGAAKFKTILDPGQKCQFNFGAWTNASGSMTCTIGSIDESSGSTTQTVYRPTITTRRIV